LLLPATALAHAEDSIWTFDPWIVIPMLIAASSYTSGLATLWRRAGLGRGIRRRQAGCCIAGWLLLVLASVSPLHWLGEHLFTARMVEHELVMAVAAPLLALTRPLGVFLWAFPLSLRQRRGQLGRLRWLHSGWSSRHCTCTRDDMARRRNLVLAAPVLFDDAVGHVGLHGLQHFSFLLSALASWWALIRPCRKRRRRAAPVCHHGSTPRSLGRSWSWCRECSTRATRRLRRNGILRRCRISNWPAW
jgi:putative membrane protein